MSRFSSWLRLAIPLIVCVLLGLSGDSSYGKVVSLNLTWNGNSSANPNATDQTILTSGEVTGAGIPLGNWNTVTMWDWYVANNASNAPSPVLSLDTTKVSHPNSGNLIDELGNVSGWSVKSSTGLNWFNSINNNPDQYSGANSPVVFTNANQKLLYAYGAGNPTTFTISGLSAGAYDILAYFSSNSASQTIATLGATAYSFGTPGGLASTFTQATNTTGGDYSQSGNYVRWTGVSPLSGQISFTISGPSAAGLAGLQIALPEPGSATVALLGCAALSLRRRKRVTR
jgi:hypothetical protein